ncbi:MAG: hypothetical protein HYZ28_06105 [Myxococcales bacterium]|nr:hypothetical protein [Myxococcales bacterium]
MIRVLAMVSALALLGLAGCRGSCRQLSEKLCECAANSAEKDGCLRRASQQEGTVALTPAQEEKCAELLPKCDCHAIGTAQGKKDCGLARQ